MATVCAWSASAIRLSGQDARFLWPDASVLLLRAVPKAGFCQPQAPAATGSCSAAGARNPCSKPKSGRLPRCRNCPEAIDAQHHRQLDPRRTGGHAPLPTPLVNQLACCLYASGYAQDMNQAKAIVAVETGSLAVA